VPQIRAGVAAIGPELLDEVTRTKVVHLEPVPG
jgi:hypothetical protein